MFGQQKPTEDAGAAGQESARSFATRFGQSNAVSASVDISSNKFAF